MSVSIRSAWGAPWSENKGAADVKNGLILMMSWGTKQASTYPYCRMTAVDLATFDNSGGQWLDVASPPGDFYVYGVPDASCIISVIQPGVSFTNDLTTEQTGYAPLVVKGTYYQKGGKYGTTTEEYVTTSVQLPSFRFKYSDSGDPTKGSITEDSWTKEQFEAAIPCWTLLGVVVAPPPLDKENRLGSFLSVSFGNGVDKGTSLTIDSSYAVSVGTGGDKDAVSCTGSFSHGNSWSHGSSYKETIVSGYSLTQNGGEVPAESADATIYEDLKDNTVGLYLSLIHI